MTVEHEAWLALRTEEAIDPDLPIIDPHHHLWERPNDTYLLEQVLRDTGSGHNVVKTVFLECSAMYRQEGPDELRPVGETEFVERVTAQSAGGKASGGTEVAAGIVGFADLALGASVASVLEAHLEASPDRFRGIRRSTAADPSPAISGYMNPPQRLLLDARFREGFACLQRYGLSFDACAFHPQLTELADLARTFPDVTIILDHIGGPLAIGPYAGQRETVLRTWATGISEVAACPNVVVKLGGLGMPVSGLGWEQLPAPPSSTEMAEGMAPYYLWCIEQFGVDRCMFESNFPVDRVASSYAVLWNAFKRLVHDFTADERAALFHDTAARVYRID